MVQHKFFNMELARRVLSMLILVPIAILLINLGGYFFISMVISFAVLMGHEWSSLTIAKKTSRRWQIFGVFYIMLPCLSLIWLSNQDSGTTTIISILVIVWATDIGGYIVGKNIGGPKLSPKISPNKTWSGFFGGLILALISGYLVSGYNIMHIAFISIMAQIGDLVESQIKRHFNTKDSGDLLPGHGGILDAVDGIIIVAPLMVLIEIFG